MTRNLVLALVLPFVLQAVSAQQIHVQPAGEVLLGDPLQISLGGLPAGATVELTASRMVREFTGGQRSYASSARYSVGADGRVDLATATPISGSYTRADTRGLFWSMLPSPSAADGLALNRVRLQAKLGDKLVADHVIAFRQSLPQVSTRPAEGFPGSVFASLAGPEKRPALILLGGSEGGSMIARDAPVFASRGFAALALPYYSPPGWGPNGPTPPELPALPPVFADIPVERLQAARDWLAAQPEVDPTRIGVIGTSKGAEFALIAATRMPWIRAVAAIVPTDVVWEGWGNGIAPGQRASFAFEGKPLPFVPYKDFDKEFAGFQTGADVRIRRPQDAGRAAHPGRVPAARIPIENYAGPLFLLGGHDDQVWDSGGMAEAIAAARARNGRETVALVFRDAGHAIGGTGWTPTTQYNAGPMKMGGTPQANAAAQAEAWPRLIEFLQRHLGPLPKRPG